MKRTLSIIIALALLLGSALFGGILTGAEEAREIVTLIESGFENGMEDPYFANGDAGTATITHVTVDAKGNGYAHITERTAGQRSATIQQNVLAQLQANGSDGKYYISARIKLDNEGDTAYAVPILQGNSFDMRPGGGERFEVTDEWTEVGKKSDGSYMAFGGVTNNLSHLPNLTRCKFYIMLFTTASGTQTAYNGDYKIDDIVLWFVPNEGAPEQVLTIGDNELIDGDFEAYSNDPDHYNNTFSGNGTWYVATADGSGSANDRLHKVTLAQEDVPSAYAHITERTAGQRSATIQQNVLAQLQANGSDGKYYISAKIKLDEPGDKAYAVPILQGNSFDMRPGGGERFEVTDDWTEIGKKSDGSYMAFGSVTNNLSHLPNLTRCKFYIMLFTTASGTQTAYNGDYKIDDIVLWFVPNEGAPEQVLTIGDNELIDGDFEAHAAEPMYYNNTFGGNGTWYVATADGSGSANDRLHKVTVVDETLAAARTTHNGRGALYVTNRPGAHQGVAVNMKAIVDEVGALREGEGYYLSAWMRAEDGETFTVRPIFGGGAGMVLGGEWITVTDEWTEIGIDISSGEYSRFTDEGGPNTYEPFGRSWANIRFATSGTENYYIDDFKVMGPEKITDIVQRFLDSANGLPEASEITRANEALIVSLEELYGLIDVDSLSTEQQGEVAAAKAKLDAAREAFDALPPPKNSFVPVFSYEDPANLIAPYGDLETFTTNDFVWNEENVENNTPVYTLITDPAVAHRGNNALLISGREKTQHAAAFTITEVVRANGPGKYYFSCWMKTKNAGEVMTVMPLLYYGGAAKEYYLGEYTITNEWTFVGVTYDATDSFFRSSGAEMIAVEPPVTYVALRFYGQDETLESIEDGNPFPDYYIDDLKFWKYFAGQEEYVDPDIDDESSSEDVSSEDPTSSEGSPQTGDALPLALPLLTAIGVAGAAIVTRRRRNR